MLKTTVFVFAVGFFTKEILAAQVATYPNKRTVLPGENATFLCRVAVPLQYCRIEVPGYKPFNLNKGSVVTEVAYYGKGLESGECGFTLQRAQDANNGDIKCTLGISSESTESIGNMYLTVARAPKQPELDLRGGTDSLGVYKINDVLQASCIVSEGRPAANLSWYLDDEPILQGLLMPTEMTLAKDNLHSRIQNLTKTLTASDNGRFLRCVAEHPAYPGGSAETKRQLDVKFPPLPPKDYNLDKFGYQIGKMGLINITLEANPQPQIEWDIGGQRIKEGAADNTGRIVAEPVKNLGRSQYVANLRIAAVKKEDTDVEYVLTAHNSYGSQQYKMRISTNPEPEGVDLGIGAIIGIVVAILFVVLLVSILVFAKLTGRWCFSDGSDHRNLGESSDTESADVRPKDTKQSIAPLKLTSIFKKNKDKVSSEDEPEVKTIKTEENKSAVEEINTALSTEAEQQQPPPKEGLVYAELDLIRAEMLPVVKNDDEKTEYAEIVYTPNANAKEKETPQE